MENMKQRAEEIKNKILSIESEYTQLLDEVGSDVLYAIAENEGFLEGVLDDDLEDAITELIENLGDIRMLNRIIGFEEIKLPGHDDVIALLNNLTI